MEIKKSDLLGVLRKVKPGLAKRDIIEQFTHFIFSGNEVTTYNDEICISHPLETDFVCSAKAEEFYKAIESVESDTIDLGLDEGRLTINSKKARGHILTAPEEDDAVMLIEALSLSSIEGHWKALPADFLRGVSLCMFSASKDLTKGVYTCVYIDADTLSSADGVRMSHYQMENEMEGPIFLPAVNVAELIKFEVKEYFIAESWAHFKTEDGVVFSSRIMEGEFRDLSPYFTVEGEEIKLPERLKGLVESINFMVEGKVELDRFIDLYIHPDKILCKAQKKGIGEFQKEMDFDSGIPLIHLEINPGFLTQVLEKATTVVIGENSVLFNSFTFNHVISLV